MSNREACLAEAKAAREARKADRDREVAVTKIQSIVRGWLQRKRLEKETKNMQKKVEDNGQRKKSTNLSN